MKIVNLVDNIKGRSGCPSEHGLCYYIETEKHKLLSDTGASGIFADNAKAAGIDLSAVDTVVLSHGHYDHGGGLLRFFRENERASVYAQSAAFGPYYGIHEDGPHYIGLAEELKTSGRFVKTEGNAQIDDELFLLAEIKNRFPIPSGNRSLKIRKGDSFFADDFAHEQCLVIFQGRRKVLFSGCAHHGILNILEAFRERFRSDPDAVFSGFHLMKKSGYRDEDVREIETLARELEAYDTRFYTGHCTGEEPYGIMKKILKDQLEYVYCGDTVVIPEI